MRKTVGGDKLTLHRYDGVDDDHKSKMARIGALPLDTKPGAIPEALIDDLTRKEFRELVEYLTLEQSSRAVKKVNAIKVDLNDLLGCAASGILGREQVVEFEKTTADFLKRLRRIGSEKKIVVVAGPVT